MRVIGEFVKILKTAEPRWAGLINRDTRRSDDARPARKIFGVWGSAEWHEWAARLASHAGLPRSAAIDRGLRLLARSEKFEEPPPRR